MQTRARINMRNVRRDTDHMVGTTIFAEYLVGAVASTHVNEFY
jgi:hypothetical protein